MPLLVTVFLVVDAVTSATATQPVTSDPQSPKQLVESLAHALNNADAALMLELHWTPDWDQLSEEEVVTAREKALAEMGPDQLREAQDAGDLPLSVQMMDFSLTAEFVEMRLLFYFTEGGIEEETRRAVWREGGWRLLTDRI